MGESTSTSWLAAWRCLVVCLSLVLSLPNSSVAEEQLMVEAIFNQRGVSGRIVFFQDGLNGNHTTICVNLTGLKLHGLGTFPWYVHQYPFPLDAKQDPCRAEVTGNQYDPEGASNNSDTTYSHRKVGDLSGRHGALNATSSVVELMDDFLSLRGIHSIIGRSVVLFAGETRHVCANIDYPSSGAGMDLLYVPFRSNFTGNVYFRQHSNNSTASVYVDLSSIGELENSMGHNWQIHQNPLDHKGASCTMTRSCYNPRSVDISSGMYTDVCNSTNQMECAIGDLSNKGAPLDVMDRVVKQFYTDTDLTLAGEDTFVVGRSLVIHEANGGSLRIACANISEFLPLRAEAIFSGPSGLVGSIRFTQLSPFALTRVDVSLTGLANTARDYRIHVGPIGPPDLPFQDRCGSSYTGGRWNPLDVDNNKTSATSDQYEVGDLSSKFGSLANMASLTRTFSDPNLPLFGMFGIIGRSVVIHRNDAIGIPWACADIVHTGSTVTFSYLVNANDIEGRITLIQRADDPYSPTTIIVTLKVKEALPLPSSTAPLPKTTPFSSDISTPSTSSFQTSTTSVGLIPNLESSLMPTPTPTQDAVTTLSVSSGSGMEGGVSSTIPNLPSTFSSAVQASASMTDAELSASMSLSSAFTGGQTSTFMASAELSATLISPSQDFSTSASFVDSVLSATPSPSMMARRKRRSLPQPTLLRRKRQAATTGPLVPFAWSLRSETGSAGSVMCGNIVDSSPSNPDLCSRGAPLACSVGDLTAKHGPLNLPRDAGAVLRVVFTDSNLPLSGPLSPFSSDSSSPLLMIQRNGGDEAICTGITSVPPLTTSPSSLIGPIVGGVVAAVALIVVGVVLMLLCCACVKRKSKYNLSGEAKVEMGESAPAKPVLGVPNYKALHQYNPQNEGDLAMKAGDWVTLEETPYGGGWWRGFIDGQSGWFPKTYVKYVNREAEKKRKQEENFTLAAAAIMDASSSFSTRHPSLTIKRGKSDVGSNHLAKKTSKKKAQRSHTFSRAEIDCTPMKVTKFDITHLERASTAGMVFENLTKDSSSSDGGSRPNTPASIANNVIIANVRPDDSEYSLSEGETDSLLSKTTLEGGDLNVVLHAEKFAARYDFIGTSNLELGFDRGDVILVIEKADNGWWRGVYKGKVGWFPETYVNPMSLGKASLVSRVEPDNEGRGRRRQQSAGNIADKVERPKSMDEMMATEGGDLEASEYHALFSYQSETESELVFSAGDTVWVYWGQDNGWWFGATAGKQGWFPESYVEPIIESLSVATAAVSSSVATAAEEETKMDLSDVTFFSYDVTEGKADSCHSPSYQLEAGVNRIDERSRFLSQGGSLSDEDHVRLAPSENEGAEGVLAKVMMVEGKTAGDGKSLSTDLSSTPLHHDVKDGSTPANESAQSGSATQVQIKPTALKDVQATKVLNPEDKVIKPTAKGPDTPSRRAPPPPPTGATTDVPSTQLEEAVPALLGTSQDYVLSSRKMDETPLFKSAKTTSKIRAEDISRITDDEATKPSRSQQAALELVKLRDKPTMAKGNLTMTQRRIPPPIPSALLVGTPSTLPDKPKPSEESIKATSAETTANRTSIPAPRAKARMKMVKRPTSLPPPPSIPLPLPPPHSSSSSQPTTVAPSHPLARSSRAPGTDQDATIPHSNGAALSADPTVNPVLLRVENKGIQQGTHKGPRPSPPTRISSLIPPSGMPPVAAGRSRRYEEFEEMKQREAAEASDVHKISSNSGTPPRAENTLPAAESPSRDFSNPPQSSPPPLPTASQLHHRGFDTEPGHSIPTRGSRLMSSLKKIVKRDSKKNLKVLSSKEESETKSKPVLTSSMSLRMIEPVAQCPPSEGDTSQPKQSNEITISLANTPASPTTLLSEGDTALPKQSNEITILLANTPASPTTLLSEGDTALPKQSTENRTSQSNTPPDSPTHHFFEKSRTDNTASRQQPPEKPSQPANTSPQQTPNVAASRQQPPERPSQSPNTSPQQTPNVAASRLKPPERPSQSPNTSPQQTPNVAASRQQHPERPSQSSNTSPQQTHNVAASREQPPERPSQPPNTSPQQTPNVVASRQQPPERPSRSSNTSPQQTHNVAASREQPPERPSRSSNTSPQQTHNVAASRQQPPERPSWSSNTSPQQTHNVAASRRKPPERPSQSPNTSPQQTPNVAASRQQPPERPSQPPNTSPQQTHNVAASREQPPERPSQSPNTPPQQEPNKSSEVALPKLAKVNQLVAGLDKPNSASVSNPSFPQPLRTSVTSPTSLKHSTRIPEKPPPPITATSNNSLTGGSKDTSSHTSSKKRAIIPEKPPPPVTAISKTVQKPKSPVEPTLSPKPDTTTDVFKMPGTSKLSSNKGNVTSGSSQLTAEPTLQGQVNNDHILSLEPPANFYKANNAYEAKSDDELSFAEGDTLMFIDKRDNGFYYGMKDDGLTGLFPVCSVEPFFRK